MYQLARKLAVMAISAFVFLVAAEMLARAAEPGEFRWYDLSPYEKVANLPHVHRRGAAVQWDGTFYQINSRGWRGPEFEPTFAPDELRVVAIGDSCTFGKSVEESDSWPRQLERELQAQLGASRTVRVANLGVNGYSSGDYLEVLRTQALPLEPQLVVVGYSLNDFPNVLQKVDAAVYQNQQNLRAKLSWDLRTQLSRMALFRWMRATYYELNRARDLQQVERVAQSVSDAQQASPEVLAGEAERMQQMVSESRARGAQLVAFLLPYESQVHLEHYTRGPIDALRAIAEPLGVDFIDMGERFRAESRSSDPPAKLFVRGDRYHPDAQGYSIVARSVAEVVRARRWFEPVR